MAQESDSLLIDYNSIYSGRVRFVQDREKISKIADYRQDLFLVINRRYFIQRDYTNVSREHGAQGITFSIKFSERLYDLQHITNIQNSFC